MDEASSLSAGARFQRLVEIMARLRAPGGCPWDREQTYDSIKPYTVEETYEVMDAIDRRDFRSLAEELGDLTLQVVFYAQMAAEEGRFTVSDCLDAINAKLIRRHPHVFSDGDAKTSDQVLKRWDEIKQEEKRDRGETPKGLLDSIVRAQPALLEATHILRLRFRIAGLSKLPSRAEFPFISGTSVSAHRTPIVFEKGQRGT